MSIILTIYVVRAAYLELQSLQDEAEQNQAVTPIDHESKIEQTPLDISPTKEEKHDATSGKAGEQSSQPEIQIANTVSINEPKNP